MTARKKTDRKPASVKELLVEMRDAAMLAVDLAYATLVFKDRELADEVLRLERKIDSLIHDLQVKIMLTARDTKDALALQPILHAAVATDRISNAAGDIIYPILRGAEPHPIILEGLRKLDEPIISVQVSPSSSLCKKGTDGRALRAKLGVDVLAVRRTNQWIFGTENLDRIMPKDTIIARGEDTGVQKLRELAAVDKP